MTKLQSQGIMGGHTEPVSNAETMFDGTQARDSAGAAYVGQQCTPGSSRPRAPGASPNTAASGRQKLVYSKRSGARMSTNDPAQLQCSAGGSRHAV